jgi:hypothetical protein
VQADAREEADEIVLHAFVPKGSHLVPDSITGGGTQEGERAIRWRFTNVKETPIVTFQIKVDTLEELPKDLKKLQAKTTAEAKFDDVPESAENTLAIDLVRPTTIRGVTLDIVQGASSHLAVQTPARAGVDVRLSELLSKRVVDTAKSDGSGSFSVEAGKPMRYLLESFQTAPTTKFGARPVFSRHIIEVRDGGEVWVNGRLQPTREDGSLEPLDVYVPISLVVLADKLLVALGDTDIPYWAFLRIDIGPILDFANSIGLPFTDIRFDTAEVTRVVDSALELTQVRLDGSPAQFGGLYEPGNPATERDGWNAVLRLNVMLTQLGADSTNPRRFGDALSIIRPIALAIALQVTTTAVKALAKKLKTPRAGATWRFYRISYMSEVVGVLTPLAIDIANLAGAGVDKGKWVEWIAKGSRYGMDLVMGVLEKNARWWTLFDDLTFEVIFNAVRVGVTSIMLDGWINLMAQQSLDAVGSLKSTFAGSTRAINDFVTDTERRLGTGLLSVRTLQQIQGLEATVVSMIRAFDGILSTWKAAYGHIDIDPRSKRPPSLHAIERLQNALGKSFGAGARGDEALQRVALAVNLLAIQTGVVGLEALGLEVQKIAGALTTGATASRRIAPASPVESRMATGTAAPSETSGRSARSTTSVRKLVSAAATYRSVLRDLHAAFADRTAPAAHTDVRDWRRFDQASTRIASALEPLLRRALLVRASAQGRERQRIVAFIEASRALADAQLVATEQLDPSLAAPGSNVDKRAVAPALATLDARTRLLARAVTSSRPALGGAIAGALMATPADLELPRDAVIVSGRPFAVRLTVWNVGDKPTTPALVSLTSSRNLKLVSRAAVPIKRMRAGERVILRWRLRATRSGAPQLAANATFLIRKTDSVVGALDVPIFAFGAPRSR